jgi:hypothetical protein
MGLLGETMSTSDKAWLGVLCSIFSLIVACSDKVQASYRTRADAQKSGAIARGWIPSVVPEGATEIRETHNVDSNQAWGKFLFSASKAESIRSALNEIDISSLAGQEVRSPKVNWWPSVLSGRLSDHELRATGFKFYKVQQNGVVFFAVDWQKKEAFFWRPGPYQP